MFLHRTRPQIAIASRRTEDGKAVPVLHKNKAQNSSPGESHASERSTKFYAKHLFGDDRKSRAGAGGRLMAKLSCTYPAQEQSSKQRSGTPEDCEQHCKRRAGTIRRTADKTNCIKFNQSSKQLSGGIGCK